MSHGGPVHHIASKKELAIHLGVPHDGPDGHVRVAFPSAAFRSRWRRDELEREHQILHEGKAREEAVQQPISRAKGG